MKTTHTLILALVFATAALPVFQTRAQTSPDTRFQRLDKNGDGKLSAEEIGIPSAFTRADANRDGSVSPAELQAYLKTRQDNGKAKAAPQRPAQVELPERTKVERDLRYRELPGVDANLLSLDIYAPKDAKNLPVMIYTHGGGWQGGDKANCIAKAAHFTQAGFVFASINYRLSPAVTHPAHIEDVVAALAWMKQNAARFGGDGSRMLLMGHSAGAHLTALAATDAAKLKAAGLSPADFMAAIVLDNPAFDVLRLVRDGVAGNPATQPFGKDEASWRDASPQHHIAKGTGIAPMLLAVAASPAGEGKSGEKTGFNEGFAKVLREAGVRCEVVDAAAFASHSSLNQNIGTPRDSVTAEIMRFIDSVLNATAVNPALGSTIKLKAERLENTNAPADKPKSSAASASAPGKPNIVILFADDLGYADVGFQGGKVPTPAIDRLAAESVRFTQGYVSASVCSPSRAGLMTGRYQNRFGHETNPATVRSAGTPTSEITIAELLREQGYRTALVGKWHLGVLDEFHPMQQGFDEFFGFLHGAHTYFPEQARGENLLRGREPVVEKEYLTDAFAREAVSFIERNHQQPFFLYLSFNAVHTPLEASRKYLDRFPNLSGNAQTYAAMISAMDDAVGRVMDCLKTQGLDERTLVFFLDDNGGLRPQASNLPLNGGKATYFEGGIRVPFLARWPGQLAPGEYRHPVISLDILPTAVALAGGTLPADRTCDGVNLMPYLTSDNPARPHETLFWRMRDMRAEVVRHGDWKYVKVKDAVSLFDLASDLGETRNLAAEKPDLVRDLAARYATWDKQMAEPLWSFPAEERRERQTKRKNQAAKGEVQ
jgi:arylsulfatase A-like enzyme/acetyl esterase/lipase